MTSDIKFDFREDEIFKVNNKQKRPVKHSLSMYLYSDLMNSRDVNLEWLCLLVLIECGD